LKREESLKLENERGNSVAETEFFFDIGAFVDGGFEFADIEIGHDEIAVLEGRSESLTADLVHSLSRFNILQNIAHIESDVFLFKVGKRFGTPRAARFYVEYRP